MMELSSQRTFIKKWKRHVPIEAAIKGSNEIFFARFCPFDHPCSSISSRYFSGRICRAIIPRIWVVISAAVLISAFVSLTLMLNAYLMKGGESRKIKFSDRTLF
jgi:HAE1 family hydrophobic/amphiphilic exporter-1/multidrug efflux pump